jgi:hypothetical protein
MSLESSIELLAHAINELTAAVRGGQTVQEKAAEDVMIQFYKNRDTAGDKPEKTEVKKSPEVPTTPEPSKASAQTTESSSPAPTYDDVKKLILAISAKNRDKVVALLARYGAKKGPDLKEEQYALFVHEGNLILSGDLDPEAGA